jgi:hypothetical protein
MFPINRKAVCGVWCVLVLGVSGQNAVPNAGDRLEAENAVRLREFEKNNDEGGPRRPVSPELNAVSSSVLENLSAEELAKMTLDDPVLKAAYVEVMMSSFEQMEPPQKLALADMRRRGEAVSPVLLKLISENQETNLESDILGKIERLDTVDIEPFLDYARKLLRERTKTMTAYSAGVASYVIRRHGAKEDEALFEWVIKERPYVASTFAGSLKILRDRLNPPQPETRPERREISSSNPGGEARAVQSGKDHPQDKGSAPSRAKPLLFGGIILVVLLGLYRFVRLRLRELSS